jgi:hypothetical protein
MIAAGKSAAGNQEMERMEGVRQNQNTSFTNEKKVVEQTETQIRRITRQMTVLFMLLVLLVENTG